MSSYLEEIEPLFDTRDNHVTVEQICDNLKKRMNSKEYKDAMTQLVKEMKLEKPHYFKK
jgi:hypothetical protein